MTRRNFDWRWASISAWLLVAALSGCAMPSPGDPLDRDDATGPVKLDTDAAPAEGSEVTTDLPDCPADSALGAGHCRYQLRHQGRDRKFDLYVPAPYDGTVAVPLILDFHGFAGTSGWIARNSGFRELAGIPSERFPQGFVVAYPANIGLYRGWNAGTCCGWAEANNLDDEGFVLAILEILTAKLRIDPSRIYLTGHSNGAMLAQLLGKKHPELFAAIAPVSSSSVAWRMYPDPAPDRPMPTISFMGHDDKCPYDPGQCSGLQLWFGQLLLGAPADYVGFDENFERWARRDGCATRVPEDDGDTAHKPTYTANYTDCFGGVEVAKWVVQAAHDDVYQNGSATNPRVDIARTAWDFMSRFTSRFATIAKDDFEDQDLTDWAGPDSGLETYTFNVTDHCARLAKQESMQKTFDLAGTSAVVLRYQWRTKGLERDEHGLVEWSIDGIHWTELERVRRPFDMTWETSSIRLDGAAGNSQVHLRFRNTGSTSTEYFYVDNIVLAAQPR